MIEWMLNLCCCQWTTALPPQTLRSDWTGCSDHSVMQLVIGQLRLDQDPVLCPSAASLSYILIGLLLRGFCLFLLFHCQPGWTFEQCFVLYVQISHKITCICPVSQLAVPTRAFVGGESRPLNSLNTDAPDFQTADSDLSGLDAAGRFFNNRTSSEIHTSTDWSTCSEEICWKFLAQSLVFQADSPQPWQHSLWGNTQGSKSPPDAVIFMLNLCILYEWATPQQVKTTIGQQVSSDLLINTDITMAMQRISSPFSIWINFIGFCSFFANVNLVSVVILQLSTEFDFIIKHCCVMWKPRKAAWFSCINQLMCIYKVWCFFTNETNHQFIQEEPNRLVH